MGLVRAGVLIAAIALVLGAQAQLPKATPNGIAAFPPLWPLPKAYSNGTQAVTISPKVTFVGVQGTAVGAEFAAAVSRFRMTTFEHTPLPLPPNSITTVQVSIANDTAELQLYVNESYSLAISADGTAQLQAETVYGAYHGLESLSQLVGFDFTTQQYVVRHAPWSIIDAPRFPHRGLLIDTSRHFEPIRTIKRVIDSVTFAKFNAVHWHIVDAESFPYMSTKYPKLGMQTSYAPTQRFTPNDVKDVVAYGKARGIRVMVELDTPGHSASMCYGYPEMCPAPFCPSKNVNNWALDITKNFTYDVVEGVLSEFNELFPEKMIHLGGDEVVFWCWEGHPSIVAWLEERGLTFKGGYEYYVKRIQDYVWSTYPDRLVVGWQEIWDNFGTALSAKTIIQQWLPHSIALPLNVTSHGYRLVWSDSSVWYLDKLAVNWTSVYTAEPCNGLPDENCALILGGEGCMWGETVDTSDIMQTIWPRAAAIGERLWSPRPTMPEATPSDATLARILAFRCLLNRRGVAAAPVDNSNARQPPVGPGSCYWQ